jgi:hypothetical protein
MASYYFGNERSEALKFASLLNNLANDIISEHVRLIEVDHQRETSFLAGRETLSIHFYRLSQEDN